MNHSPAQIMAGLLQDGSDAPFTDPVEGLDWPVYISSLPDGMGVPDNCAAVFDTAGPRVHRTLSGLKNFFHYGFQIRVRCLVYEDGWAKAEVVSKVLEVVKRRDITLGTSSYRIDSIWQASSPLSMGVEPTSRRRSHLSINGVILVSEL